MFERARPRMSTTRLAPARRLWRGGGHVGVVGAAKLGSDLEATNRAVGVSGSAHTKAALARGRDAVVEGDASVVEAHVEERRLLGVNDGGLAQDGLRRRRLVQEAVGRRQEQGSYEIGLRAVSRRRPGGRKAVPKLGPRGGGSARCRLTAWAGKQAPAIRLNRLDFTLGSVLEAPGARPWAGSLAASRPQYEGKGKCGALWGAKRMFAGSTKVFAG